MEMIIVLCAAIFALGFAVYLTTKLLRKDMSNPGMQRIAEAIREGAEAFLARQYKTIAALSLPSAAILFVLYAFIRPPTPFDPVASC